MFADPRRMERVLPNSPGSNDNTSYKSSGFCDAIVTIESMSFKPAALITPILSFSPSSFVFMAKSDHRWAFWIWLWIPFKDTVDKKNGALYESGVVYSRPRQLDKNQQLQAITINTTSFWELRRSQRLRRGSFRGPHRRENHLVVLFQLLAGEFQSVVARIAGGKDDGPIAFQPRRHVF